MTALYWGNNVGAFTEAKWSTSSGSGPYTHVAPTQSDDATIEAGTCTVSSTSVCRSLTVTDAGALSGSASLDVGNGDSPDPPYNVVTIDAGATFTHTGAMNVNDPLLQDVAVFDGGGHAFGALSLKSAIKFDNAFNDITFDGVNYLDGTGTVIPELANSIRILGSNTFASISTDHHRDVLFAPGTTQTVGVLDIDGTIDATDPHVFGNGASLVITGGDFTVNYLEIDDIKLSGAVGTVGLGVIFADLDNDNGLSDGWGSVAINAQPLDNWDSLDPVRREKRIEAMHGDAIFDKDSLLDVERETRQIETALGITSLNAQTRIDPKSVDDAVNSKMRKS